MTIYFCGGEDLDFALYRSSYFGMTASAISGRSSYERAYITLGGGETGVGTGALTQTVDGNGIWVSCYIEQSSSNYYGKLIAIEHDNTDVWEEIGIGCNTTNKIGIFTKTSSTTTWRASESGYSLTAGVVYKLDFHIVSYGADGEAYVYVNNVEVLHYTGVLTAGSATTFEQVVIFGGVSGTAYWSKMAEIIVADVDTRLFTLKSLAPDGAGSVSGEWTGAYTAIDEVVTSDVDMIYTTSSGEDNLWQCNVTGWPSGDWICHGVKVAYRAADGVGGFGVYGGINTYSTNYSGELQTPEGVFSMYKDYWLENPYTSNRWTSGEVNDLLLSFKAVGV